MKLASLPMVFVAFCLFPAIAIASGNLDPFSMFREQIIVGGIFVTLGILTSQFLPLDAGYSNFRTRLVYGVGGAIIGFAYG